MIQTTWSMREAVEVTPQGRLDVIADELMAVVAVTPDVLTAFPAAVAVPVLALAVGVVGDGCAKVPVEGAWQPMARQADAATTMTARTTAHGRTLSDPPFTFNSPGRAPQRP